MREGGEGMVIESEQGRVEQDYHDMAWKKFTPKSVDGGIPT